MLFRSRKTFITSDLHFGHPNICRFCNRPYATVAPNKNPANTPLMIQMKEDILSAFDKLPKDCDIWNLGDFYFAGGSHQMNDGDFLLLRDIVKRMKGDGRRLFLVLGNHDTLHFQGQSRIEFYEEIGFDKVYDTPVIVEDNFILSHEPVYLGKGNTEFINFYGHTHDKDIEPDYFCYDYDNYAKILREAKAKGQEAPQMVKKFPEREYTQWDIDQHYINCCIDKHKGFIEWTGNDLDFTGHEVDAWVKVNNEVKNG